MRSVAITNQKGGCGKTTTAINLAAALAAAGQRVLLVDLDPQAHASAGVGVSPEQAAKTLYHALAESTQPTSLRDTIVSVAGGFDLAPGHILLSTLEQELADREGGITRLAQQLAGLPQPYDFVLIDTPPSLGFLTFNALRAATEVIVPIDISSFALGGVAKLFNMLDLIKVKTEHRFTSVKALVTSFDRRSKYARQMLGLIRATFHHQVYTTIMSVNIALREAASRGVPVAVFNKYAAGTRQHAALAQELLQELRRLDPDAFAQSTRALLRRVAFALHHPEAQTIHVVGDFNQWTVSDQSLLHRQETGLWSKELDLPPGRYRYKFVIDGQWREDPNNPRAETNPFGSSDSVLLLE